MNELKTRVDRRSEAHAMNERAMAGLVADLRAKTAVATSGGGASARDKHLKRGKLLPRQRIDRLLDPGSPFLELSPLAAAGMYGDEVPSGGVITALGAFQTCCRLRPSSKCSMLSAISCGANCRDCNKSQDKYRMPELCRMEYCL